MIRARTAALGLHLAAFIVVSPGRAQDTTATCAFDTAARRVATWLAVGLAPGWRTATPRPLPPDYMAAATAIRLHYRAPDTLSLPLWAQTPRATSAHDSTDAVGHGLDSYLRFRLTPEGRLTGAPIEVATASAEFDASLVAAVRRADSARAFPGTSDAVRRDEGTIVLRVIDWDRRRGPAAGLVRVALQMLQVDSPAVVVELPRLNFPRKGRGAGDDVIVTVVVTESGRPDTATVQLLYADYRPFALEVMEAVRYGRFAPARVAGCPVPQQIRQHVKFYMRQ